jgi:hypothetical protein
MAAWYRRPRQAEAVEQAGAHPDRVAVVDHRRVVTSVTWKLVPGARHQPAPLGRVVQVEAGNARALVGEAQHRRRTEAGRRAGDQRDLPVESPRAIPPRLAAREAAEYRLPGLSRGVRTA